MAPDPAPEAALPWRQQVSKRIEAQLLRYPLWVQYRTLWQQLQAERAHWPFLLPALGLFFFLVYRRERKLVVAQRRNLSS